MYSKEAFRRERKRGSSWRNLATPCNPTPTLDSQQNPKHLTTNYVFKIGKCRPTPEELVENVVTEGVNRRRGRGRFFSRDFRSTPGAHCTHGPLFGDKIVKGAGPHWRAQDSGDKGDSLNVPCAHGSLFVCVVDV